MDAYVRTSQHFWSFYAYISDISAAIADVPEPCFSPQSRCSWTIRKRPIIIQQKSERNSIKICSKLITKRKPGIDGGLRKLAVGEQFWRRKLLPLWPSFASVLVKLTQFVLRNDDLLGYIFLLSLDKCIGARTWPSKPISSKMASRAFPMRSLSTRDKWNPISKRDSVTTMTHTLEIQLKLSKEYWAIVSPRTLLNAGKLSNKQLCLRWPTEVTIELQIVPSYQTLEQSSNK